MRLSFLTLLILFSLMYTAYSQESGGVLQRTAEQEATKQTDKLRNELNLTIDQTRRIYLINLRYERKRLISNTRAEAIERIKNKTTEIENVLTEEQIELLRNKRYERPSGENIVRVRNQTILTGNMRNGNLGRAGRIVVIKENGMGNARNRNTDISSEKNKRNSASQERSEKEYNQN